MPEREPPLTAPKEKTPRKTYLDKKGLPTRSGVYLVKFPWWSEGEPEEEEIDVYRHPIKGLCCFQEDFGSSGTGVNDKHDCHVSVQNTGIIFIRRLRNFTYYGRSQRAGELPPFKKQRRELRKEYRAK